MSPCASVHRVVFVSTAIWLQYLRETSTTNVTCDKSTNSCTISCASNQACKDLNIASKQFLSSNTNHSISSFSSLSSLSVQCTADSACTHLAVDCHPFGVQNCTIGCLADNACSNVSLSCDIGGDSSQHCFIYTIDAHSAVSDSSIDCKFAKTATTFCGFQCGQQSDGCYGDNTCVAHGSQTKCECNGLLQACDIDITRFQADYDLNMTQFATSVFVTNRQTQTPAQSFSVWNEISDEVLMFVSLAMGVALIMLFILCYVCKLQIINGRVQRVCKEYDVGNQGLHCKLLTNDALPNMQLNQAGNPRGGSDNQTKLNKTETNLSTGSGKQSNNIWYNDEAELGEFKLIPDIELDDNLFNEVVVDDDDDY